MKIPFVKMHGIGNDFVVIDNLKKNLSITADTVKCMADRKFGIGADQVLVIETSESCDCRMIIFNADGSHVEMCGNGIRCVAAYYRENICNKNTLRIETLGGEKKIEFFGDLIEVDMGEPVFVPKQIPVNLEGANAIERNIEMEDKNFNVTALSMGNPHCVLFVDDCLSFPLEVYGALFEKHAIFPNNTNFECSQIIDDTTVRTRVWERGVGITLACGTGACASYVAACLAGKVERSGLVILDGGQLYITWSPDDNHVFMRGPAEEVFQGIYYLKK